MPKTKVLVDFGFFLDPNVEMNTSDTLDLSNQELNHLERVQVQIWVQQKEYLRMLPVDNSLELYSSTLES